MRRALSRSCLPLLLLPLLAAAAGAREGSPAAELRLEGRIRSVAADRSSFELDVFAATSPSGIRRRFAEPVLRRVALAPVCYVADRRDSTVFYSRREIEPGKMAAVVAREEEDETLAASEVQLGGELPALAEPAGGAALDPARITLPPLPGGRAKYEPSRGCYLGAFVMRDENVAGEMDIWEERVGKGHASYLRYVGYGQPFPAAWVREVRRVGAAPNIAWEPNRGLSEVRDNAYLRHWARAAAASGGPVFLRFASEMNGAWTAYSGSPVRYRAAFRIVARVMRQVAPNVAMVWTPYCMPVRNIPAYYPGDDAVDWVGVNIYSVHHHNGDPASPAHHEDPAELLLPIYNRYAARKPIQISEYAATNHCLACGQSMPEFAVRKMQRIYRSLPVRFPRVRMIYWFSWDTISGGAAENNYAVTGDERVLNAYRSVTRSPYFLSRIPPVTSRDLADSAGR